MLKQEGQNFMTNHRAVVHAQQQRLISVGLMKWYVATTA
jgi:hypothetical protein